MNIQMPHLPTSFLPQDLCSCSSFCLSPLSHPHWTNSNPSFRLKPSLPLLQRSLLCLISALLPAKKQTTNLLVIHSYSILYLFCISIKLFTVQLCILKKLFICLFAFGCVGSSLLSAGSLVGASGGYSSLRYTGFSLRWLLLLRSMGSRCVGFSSCGTQAQ